MKKILFFILMYNIFHMAVAVPVPPTCQDNNWFGIQAKNSIDLENEKKYGFSKPMIYCVLPNGNYYTPWDLENNRQTKYKKLFKQYSGKQPTNEQIEKAKEKLREAGYTVN